MKISKSKLRQIIKEEIGRLDRADEPPGGWTTSRGRRKRPLGKPVPVGDPEEKRDYDEEDLLAMQHGNPEGSPLEETEETALNSPRQAGREWSYENLANTVGDLVREALEGHGLDADSIRDAIAEALDEELGPVANQEPRVTSTGPWAPEKL